MKKKILTMCLVAALAATAIVGGTLAYFTDTDSKDNVFTVGNVDITLKEEFEQNSNLLPGDKDTNNVTKKVWLGNDGSESAYVRVHIAIPTILDDGNPNFDASKNVLHFNNSNMAKGQWNWSTSLDRLDGAYTKDGNWNFYKTLIEEGGKTIEYNVYVVTYETALAALAETPAVMDQVYLDSKTSNDDINRINEKLGKNWEIKVFAEAVQSVGFEDAYDAFESAYKEVGTYNPWSESGVK